MHTAVHYHAVLCLCAKGTVLEASGCTLNNSWHKGLCGKGYVLQSHCILITQKWHWCRTLYDKWQGCHLILFMLLARGRDFHIIPTIPFCSHQYFLVVLSQGVISYHIIESNRGGRQGDTRRHIGCWSKRGAHLSSRYQQHPGICQSQQDRLCIDRQASNIQWNCNFFC